MKLKYLVFDTETTGTHPYLNGIHQLAGMIIIDGVIKERFNFFIRPYKGCEFDIHALDVSGITTRKISGYTPERIAYVQFMNLLRKYVDPKDHQDKYFLVGYFNLHMDNDFLGQFMQRNAITINPYSKYFWSGALDVSVLALNKFKYKRDKLEDFKLATVARYAGVKVKDSKLHGAEYDVDITWELMKKVDIFTDY